MNNYKRISNYLLSCKSGFKQMQVTKFQLPVTAKEADKLRNALSMRLTNDAFKFGFLRLDQADSCYFYLVTYEHEHKELVDLTLTISSWCDVKALETFACDSDLAMVVLVQDILESVHETISTSAAHLPPVAIRKIESLEI